MPDRGTRARVATLAALAILLLLPLDAGAATSRVRAEGNDWVPGVKRIVRGNSIVWANPTSKKHDVVSRGSNWSYRAVLLPGERTAPKRFGRTGRFRYRCTLHSGIVDGVCQGMCGVIRVRRP